MRHLVRHPPKAQTQNRWVGGTLIAISAISWSGAGFFTRLIHEDAWTTIFWRGIFGSVFVGIYAGWKYRAQLPKIISSVGWPGWAISLGEALGMVAFIAALKHTTVAAVAVIYATVPLVAAAIAWLWIKERSSRSLYVCSAISILGVAIMLRESWGSGGLLGNALAVAMTLQMAATMVAIRRYPDIPFVAVSFLANLLGSLVVIPFANLHIGRIDTSYLALFGFTQMAIGLTLFGLGARLMPAAEVALVGTLETPLAPLWVWLIFSETPSFETMASGGLIVFAVLTYLAISLKHQNVA